MITRTIAAKRLDRAWEDFKSARDARDAAQRAYDKAWAVYSELDDANEANEIAARNRDRRNRQVFFGNAR